MGTEDGQGPQAALRQLMLVHGWVDQQAQALASLHGPRLRCGRGCSQCCVDGLTVFAIEAQRIMSHCADVLQQAPGPVGACAFLDAEGACRVYAHRPYVCRTQGLPLRWLSMRQTGAPDAAAADLEDNRDICELNLPGGPPLEQLDISACWNIGPVERKLSELQELWQGNGAEAASGQDSPPRLTRVELRSLFAPPHGPG